MRVKTFFSSLVCSEHQENVRATLLKLENEMNSWLESTKVTTLDIKPIVKTNELILLVLYQEKA